MGRYGIGARVRDGDGDIGTVVAKRKGEREVGYEDAPLEGMRLWWPKAELTAVATEKPSAEKGEVAFAVGDRVVFTTTDPGCSAVYYDGVMTVENVAGDIVTIAYPPFGEWTEFTLTQGTTADCLQPFRLETGKTYRTRDGRKVGPMAVVDADDVWTDLGGLTSAFSEPGNDEVYSADGYWLSGRRNAIEDIVGLWAEPAAEPAPEPAPAALTIEAGRYYRTRDGRKVGPAQLDGWGVPSDSYGNVAAAYVPKQGSYTIDGIWLYGRGESDHDLVAEWVEPEATIEAVAGQKFKVGDRVVATRATSLLHIGQEYEILRYNSDSAPVVRVTTSDENNYEYSYGDDWFELVQPKFKVGDKVDLMRDGEPVERWSNMTITSMDRGNSIWPIMTDGGLQVHEDELRLSPAKPAWTPKFKVGDVVNYILTENSWKGTTITEVPESEGRIYLGKHPREGEGGFFEDQIVAAPATPLPAVGTKVTLTATVTGHNPVDHRNVQVVVDGLPPGRNSIGVSPAAISIAA